MISGNFNWILIIFTSCSKPPNIVIVGCLAATISLLCTSCIWAMSKQQLHILHGLQNASDTCQMKSATYLW